MQKQQPREKVIVSAALTGVLATRKQCPYLPYTAAEIADEAVRSYEAGAAIVHIHAREDDGKPSWRPELFEEIAKLTRKRCPVILNFSTGGIGNTIVDIWLGLTKPLYVDKSRKRTAAEPVPVTASIDWRSVLYHGHAGGEVPHVERGDVRVGGATGDVTGDLPVGDGEKQAA